MPEEEITYRLKRLSRLLQIPVYILKEEQLLGFSEYPENDPLYVSETLRKLLVLRAEQQEEPVIYGDEQEVYFVCVRGEQGILFAGPVCLGGMDRVELRRYYSRYGMDKGHQKGLKSFTLAELLDISGLLCEVFTKEQFGGDRLIAANHLVVPQKQKEAQEQVIFELKRDMDELYHHTYMEERRLLDCVREGKAKEALEFTASMDRTLGIMSEKALNQWKNTAIVGITLCTRAAIEGGILPSVAYQLSDFYIQKCDGVNSITRIVQYRDAAIERLANEVKKRLERKVLSNYVEQCQDYVRKHYREKIYAEDIAESLGISAAYLSRLFHKEAGMRLQDYILSVRLDHAANLLMYSDEPIARIAEYVNFPSQSYFGRVFKEKMQMSPRRYRELHKPKEF